MLAPQHVTGLLLAILLQSLAPWELAAHEHVQASANAGCSLPCPDETPEGDPCPEGCACLCCPGHARVLPGASVSVASFVQPQRFVCAARRLRTFDLVSRVYRPPRAA